MQPKWLDLFLLIVIIIIVIIIIITNHWKIPKKYRNSTETVNSSARNSAVHGKLWPQRKMTLTEFVLLRAILKYLYYYFFYFFIIITVLCTYKWCSGDGASWAVFMGKSSWLQNLRRKVLWWWKNNMP